MASFAREFGSAEATRPEVVRARRASAARRPPALRISRRGGLFDKHSGAACLPCTDVAHAFSRAVSPFLATYGDRRSFGSALRLQPDRGGPCEPDAKSLAVGSDHFGH